MINKNIICIYPVDSTTDFLIPLYELLSKFDNFKGYRLVTADDNIQILKNSLSDIESGSILLFLGHGASHCLYGSHKERIFTSLDLDLLEKFECIFLSCRSEEFLKQHNEAYIGFGDMPTDYAEVESERTLNDCDYLKGYDSSDIEYYRQQIVNIFADAINFVGIDSLERLYKSIKLFANKEISRILVNKEDPNYRARADLLFEWKDEITYHSKTSSI